MTIPSMDEQILSMDKSVIRWCHPWTEEPHPWMKASSVYVIHGWRNLIHGWRNLIHGWHPRMRMTDDGHGRSNRSFVTEKYLISIKKIKTNTLHRMKFHFVLGSHEIFFIQNIGKARPPKPLKCPSLPFSVYSTQTICLVTSLLRTSMKSLKLQNRWNSSLNFIFVGTQYILKHIQMRAKQTARLLPYGVKWVLFKRAWGL